MLKIYGTKIKNIEILFVYLHKIKFFLNYFGLTFLQKHCFFVLLHKRI